MSRWTPGKPLDQVMQVRMPFSGKDGHKVGNGRKAGKPLTAAVKEAEAARNDARAVLDEMRDLNVETRARVRRAVWTVAACAVASVGSFLYALARIGAL